MAGAVSRTVVSPAERMKILFQARSCHMLGSERIANLYI